jgi:hypothetical protein
MACYTTTFAASLAIEYWRFEKFGARRVSVHNSDTGGNAKVVSGRSLAR